MRARTFVGAAVAAAAMLVPAGAASAQEQVCVLEETQRPVCVTEQITPGIRDQVDQVVDDAGVIAGQVIDQAGGAAGPIVDELTQPGDDCVLGTSVCLSGHDDWLGLVDRVLCNAPIVGQEYGQHTNCWNR